MAITYISVVSIAMEVSSQKVCLSALDSLWGVCFGKSKVQVGDWKITENWIWL